MNLFYNIRTYSIHIFPFFLFLAITLLYCFPILEGKKINQSDHKQFLGMSKEIVDYRDKTGQEALWTNSMFGGMPAYQISVHHPNNILVHIDQFFQLYLPRPVGIIFLYFIGFYILLLSLKINPHLSILGALAFGMSSYFFIILEAGHNTKAHAIAYIAPVVASFIYCFNRDKTALLSQVPIFFFSFLSLGLHLRANHLQITYYLLFILFFFWVSYLLDAYQKQKIPNFIRQTSIFSIAGIMAISINLGNIWSTYDYSHHTIRGDSELLTESGDVQSGLDTEYATAWSYGKVETFNMFFPNFVGGSSHSSLSENSNLYKALRQNRVSKRDSRNFIKSVPLYFGPQSFTSGPVYLGAITWLLFFIGLFIVKKPIKWVLLSLVCFSFILAWGKYFPVVTNLFLDYFPLYNKFRTVSMILIIAQFAVPLLAILGLHKIIYSDIEIDEKKKIIIKSALLLICTSIFFLLFRDILFDFKSQTDARFPSWFIDALIQDRANLFRLDILRSVFFVSISAVLIYIIIQRDLRMQPIWIYVLSIFVIADMWFINKRHLNSDDFIQKADLETPFTMQEYDKLIKEDTSIYRVYNLNERLDQGARTSYFHHSLGGYHGAKLGKYQDLIDFHLTKGNMNVINMLNTKYIIAPNENQQPIVQQNPEALGNAWLVDSIQWVNNANEALDQLHRFYPKNTVIIDKKYQEQVNNTKLGLDGSIELTSYSPNKLVYNISSKTPALVVFSEIFYPNGWRAYIDDNFVEHFPVNYLLRGLIIPNGSHEVVFEFKPKSFFVSAKLSLFSSCLLICVSLITFGRLFFFNE
tara:strand:- start:15008 stop:17434 length:2427 start_codon:yes stop_codon:yes gene_type:complete